MGILISRGAQHAIKALVHLTELPSGSAVPVHELAGSLSIPPSFLSKVVRQLVEAGVLTATRGRGGGVRLARSPSDISVLDVIESVDGDDAPGGCMLSREKCDGGAQCSLHVAWRQVRDDLRAALSGISLAETTAQEPSGVIIPTEGSRPAKRRS